MSQAIDNKTIEKHHFSTPPTSAPPVYTPHLPDITAAFSNLDLTTIGSKPTKDQCIAHLKLLEAFHQLREDTATRNGLFGIWDSFVPAIGSDREQAEVLLKIREKRWAVYVAKAASRFEKWWQTSIQPGSLMVQQTDLTKSDSKIADAAYGDDHWNFTKDNLPPLGMDPSSRHSPWH